MQQQQNAEAEEALNVKSTLRDQPADIEANMAEDVYLAQEMAETWSKAKTDDQARLEHLGMAQQRRR